MIRIFSLLFIFTASLNAQNITDTTVFNLNSHDIRMLHDLRVQSGDKPEWAKPSFVDSNWLLGNPNQLPKPEPGIHWYRAKINLVGKLRKIENLVLPITHLPSAFEVFWDGSLVENNGQVGPNQSGEIAGKISLVVQLSPESTTPGIHTIALRFSNFRGASRFQKFRVFLVYHRDWIKARSKFLFDRYLWIGIFLTATVLSLALFLGGGRHRSFILFALFCFLHFIDNAVSPLNEAYQFNVVYMDFILTFRYLIYISTSIILNVFFLYHFNLSYKRIHFLIMVVLLFPVVFLVPTVREADFYQVTMLIYANGLLITAVLKRKAGSFIALLGALLLLISWIHLVLNVNIIFITKLLWTNILYFIPLIFIFFIILSISQQIREQNRLYHSAKLRSHRLETQLLKSQIQPHFISNTLHSIKSWFREDPKKAEKLIQTLSEEFRIINKISSETTISIEEEIRLCQYHLEIMGSRRDVRFELVTENIPEDEKVPPLIFHTLIENGLTHAYLPRENGRFWLRYEKNGRETLYRLKNDGSLLQHFSEQEKSDIEEGLGLTYIKARLEESFPSRWKIKYGLKNGLWEVSIHIKK